MVYMLMIYGSEAEWMNNSPKDVMATLAAHKALEDELRKAGKFRGGGGLDLTTSAKTVRFKRGAPMVTDGPFAETKEQFGGFYLVEAGTIEEALSYAARVPGIDSRAIEVRNVLHASEP